MVDRFGGVPLDQVTGTTTDRFGGVEVGAAPAVQAPVQQPVQEQEQLIDSGRVTTEGRPIFKNQFGDFVTERSITITDPRINQGRATNIPTVFEGRFLNQDEAGNRG